MRQRTITLAVICLAMIAPTALYAQEWSTDQKEVWKNVETYWDLGAKGEIEEFLTYFHDDFSGWNIGAALPANRDERIKIIRFSQSRNKSLFYRIQPLAIKIHGDVAFVHYYYMDITEDDEGNETEVQGRWTDILIKQGDKWIMIGDHGGPIPGDD